MPQSATKLQPLKKYHAFFSRIFSCIFSRSNTYSRSKKLMVTTFLPPPHRSSNHTIAEHLTKRVSFRGSPNILTVATVAKKDDPDKQKLHDFSFSVKIIAKRFMDEFRFMRSLALFRDGMSVLALLSSLPTTEATTSFRTTSTELVDGSSTTPSSFTKIPAVDLVTMNTLWWVRS